MVAAAAGIQIWRCRICHDHY